MAKNNNLGDFLTDIANAIREKKGKSGAIQAQDFSSEIRTIQGEGGEVDEYYYYSKAFYTLSNNATLFQNAWQDSQDAKTVLYDIPLTLAATEQEFFDGTADFYAGTDGALAQLYNDCLNGVITPTVDLEGEGVPNEDGFTYLVNNSPLLYVGDYGSLMGYPVPVYVFGMKALMSLLGLPYDETATDFMVADMTSLEMGLGVVLIRQSGKSIPNNKVLFQQGVKFENENGLILPDDITIIGDAVFQGWASNNRPLVIPNSVISMGESAFEYWTSNNQPLVLPDSITSIGDRVFQGWESNNRELVIPNSVTSIGESAFNGWESNDQPLVIPSGVTDIGWETFYGWTSNNQPLVLPNGITEISGGVFAGWESNNHPLVIPNGVTDIDTNAFDGWTSNNQPLIIPDSVTKIGTEAFINWTSNNQPLVLPNGIGLIPTDAFSGWESNNHPLVIPNSLTSMGQSAFQDWKANTHPLVIPENVRYLEEGVFYNWELVPYVEIKRVTPPSLGNVSAFYNQNNAPIYVPDASVNDYKTATNWVGLASRIFPISEKP